MTEEREVEYVLIDNKKYEVVMEKTSGDTTYMYLSNLESVQQIFQLNFFADN